MMPGIKQAVDKIYPASNTYCRGIVLMVEATAGSSRDVDSKKAVNNIRILSASSKGRS